ncbi:MAG: carboxypeptidase-like regulatory domain-containing protein, partial [Bacteroidota bacterium]
MSISSLARPIKEKTKIPPSDGSALPGVNVVLKGTTAGTVTDIDGNYSFSVPSDGG